MKILLNPKYEHLRDYLSHLEEHFEQEGREIHSGRNSIRTLQVEDLTLCVKRFARATFRREVQQLIYKTSKGKLAYLRPMMLRERGFESPESVALVRYRHGLWHTTAYYVCLLSSYRYSLDRLGEASVEDQRDITDSFACFAARLHERGFLHRDFSSSNILYDKVGDRYHFSLIDTNSIRCGSGVSIETGCRNLAQLTGSEAFFAQLVRVYAAERKADPALCARLVNEARGARQAAR